MAGNFAKVEVASSSLVSRSRTLFDAVAYAARSAYSPPFSGLGAAFRSG